MFAYIGLIRGPGGVTAERFKQFTDLALLGFNFAGAAHPSSCACAGKHRPAHCKGPGHDVLV